MEKESEFSEYDYSISHEHNIEKLMFKYGLPKDVARDILKKYITKEKPIQN